MKILKRETYSVKKTAFFVFCLAIGIARADRPEDRKPHYGSPINDTIVENPYKATSTAPERIIHDIDKVCKTIEGSEAVEGIMAIGTEWGGTLAQMAGLNAAPWASLQSRINAIQALGLSKNQEAVIVLSDIVSKYPKDFVWENLTPDREIDRERWALIESLARRRDARGSKILAGALQRTPDRGRNSKQTDTPYDDTQHREKEQRSAFIHALSETGGEDAVSALIDALQDSQPDLVADAAAGLRKLGSARAYPAVDALAQGLPRDPRFASMFDPKTGKPKPGNYLPRNIQWARDDLKRIAKPSKSSMERKLKNIKLTKDLTRDQVKAIWGPADSYPGSGVQYEAYKLIDDQELWLVFNPSPPHYLEYALLLSTKDKTHKIVLKK